MELTIEQKHILGSVADVQEYIRALYGDQEGWAHIALGGGGYINEKGRYSFPSGNWEQACFKLPEQADELAYELVRVSDEGADAYICPYLHKGQARDRGTSVVRTHIHADIDGKVDLDRVELIDGFAVGSGSPGHGHVYVPLSAPVTVAQHRDLCRALGTFLGDADAKIADNDVLRAPGTMNYKGRARGGEGHPVTWMVRPTGKTVDPGELAVVLGVNLAEDQKKAQQPPRTHQKASEDDPGDVPSWLLGELKKNTGDRSEDTSRIVFACRRAGMDLEQTRAFVNRRDDLRKRLDERPDDDVLRLWNKARDGENDGAGNTKFAGLTQAEEDAFFESRDVLRHIRDAALSQTQSPWALLLLCMLRALSTVPPNVKLPGPPTPGSLNCYGLLVGPPAAAKSSINNNSKRFFTWQYQEDGELGADLWEDNLGSGEGISKTFCEQGDDKRWQQVRPAVLFRVDELTTLMNSASQQKGSTVLSTLCSAWMAERLGSANMSGDRRIPLKQHEYRLCLWMAGQPKAASMRDLFNKGDAIGLTPRIIFMPALRRKTAGMPEAPCTWHFQKLDWSFAEEFQSDETTVTDLLEDRPKPRVTYCNDDERCIKVPGSVRREVLDWLSTANLEGAVEQKPHQMFRRLKIAMALAVLADRTFINEEDWTLAKVVETVSDSTEWEARTGQANRTPEEIARDRGRLKDIEEQARWASARERVSQKILAVLRKETALTQNALKNKKITASDREFVDDAVNVMVENGDLIQVGKQLQLP